MASEAGIVDVDEDNIISNYHMKSEEIFGLSLEDGEILENKYLKAREASKKPYGKLVSDNLKVLKRGDAKEQFNGFVASKNKTPQNKFASYNILKYSTALFI